MARRTELVACEKCGAFFKTPIGDGITLCKRHRKYERRAQKPTSTQKKRPANRKCLRCDRLFKSTGVENRICPSCTKTIPYLGIDHIRSDFSVGVEMGE